MVMMVKFPAHFNQRPDKKKDDPFIPFRKIIPLFFHDQYTCYRKKQKRKGKHQIPEMLSLGMLKHINAEIRRED